MITTMKKLQSLEQKIILTIEKLQCIGRDINELINEFIQRTSNTKNLFFSIKQFLSWEFRHCENIVIKILFWRIIKRGPAGWSYCSCHQKLISAVLIFVLSYTKFQNAHERETLVIERSPNFEVYYRQRNNQKIHEASISLQGKIQ